MSSGRATTAVSRVFTAATLTTTWQLASQLMTASHGLKVRSLSKHCARHASIRWTARTLIGTARVTLTWGGGDTVTRALDGSDANGPFAYPRARYLSQQFVEELCSSKGASEGLIQEIERVIFEAHPEDQREGAMTFA